MMSSQKPLQKTKILELIGICLVITALISAYGLYYTSREYAKVTETQMNADAYITGITVSKNITDPGLDIDILVLNNVSQLDIDVYLIEFRVYVSDIPINMPNPNFTRIKPFPQIIKFVSCFFRSVHWRTVFGSFPYIQTRKNIKPTKAFFFC